MNTISRPWWAFSLTMPVLETSQREEFHPNGKIFLIEGKPVYKSLHWVVYGPGFAVTALAIMGALAWTTDVRNQPHSAKVTFAVFFFVIPVLVWLIGGLVMGKLVQSRLNALTAANTERVKIAVNTAARALQLNDTPPIPLTDIYAFKLITDEGTYFSPNDKVVSIYHFIMETSQGHVNILPKSMGNIKQKLQLKSQLESFLGG